ARSAPESSTSIYQGAASPLDDLDLIRTNRQRAKAGDLTAIAYYLSETLSALGVSVQVGARTVIHRSATTLSESLNRVQHLYIVCQSSYALNPAVVAEPIAQRLRALQLQGFQDAAVVSQVQGETQADWVLRVDLTPPETILRSLVRWGDLAACREWLSQVLAPQDLHLDLELKNKTLHLFCRPRQPHTPTLTKAELLSLLQDHLHQLSPQGIHAAMVYSLPYNADPNSDSSQATPLWVDWMELPGARHPDLMPTARELAEQGDLAAILYLLDRLVNPNLALQLATGGVRVQLRQKGDLIHIMCDAPTCPRQNEVGTQAAKHIQQLRLPQVAGVRVYGRRAGQKRPLWTYGLDFEPRQRHATEATPDFSAAAEHLEDLLRVPGLDEPVETEDLELAEELGFSWHELVELGRQGLIRTQFFVPTEESSTQMLTSEPLPAVSRSWGLGNGRGTSLGHQLRVAAVWGSLGLLFALKADWSLGHWLQTATASAGPEETLGLSITTGELSPAQLEAALPPPSALDPFALDPDTATLLPGTDSDLDPAEGFIDAEGAAEGRFTQVSSALFPQGLPKDFSLKLQNPETGLVATPDYPPFNNVLLSQKLLLYQHYLVNGQVPDILIVGSSRALRGIDPAALSQKLADLGYPGLRIFNFAVNGSTAQVVDFQIRQILEADQLPQLIIWADGARAFNSGRVDVTYNAIAVSEGFKQFQAKTLPPLVQPLAVPDAEAAQAEAEEKGPSWGDRLQQWEPWLETRIGQVSSVYGDRDRLKTLVTQSLATALPKGSIFAGQTLPPETLPPDHSLSFNGDPLDPETSRLPDAPEGEGSIRMDGFLPLSLRFNPATYYQKYARVQGDYDSDYQDFRLEGKQSEALDQLLDYTQSQNIPVVFVNLPLTDDYLDPARWDSEQAFQSYMYGLMADQRLVFRDLSDLWPFAFENFSDPSHLNRFGALEVSQQLADDPLIPWPRSRDVAAQTLPDPPL
ncbi:MAG: hypothetical protein VKK80_10270, partial [Prochlorothrix sp.]|nr:hypothetical protein [Prochlorothrix sp.]